MLTNIQFSKQVNSISFDVQINYSALPANIVIPPALMTFLKSNSTLTATVNFYEQGITAPVHTHIQNMTVLPPLVNPMP